MARYLFVAALLGALAVGLLTEFVTRADSGASLSSQEVRVSALRQEDGDVLVAVQQRKTEGGWSERQLPRLNLLPAEAPAGRWHASSALDLRGESGPAGQFYLPSAIQPARSLSLAQYLSFCSDVSDQGQSVSTFLTSAAQGDPTWSEFFFAVETLIGSLQAVEPPDELSAYHDALTRLAISTAQFAVLQPADQVMDFAELAAPYSLDGPALEAAERSLDEQLAQRMRDADCIE